MGWMFQKAKSFNQPLDNWDTSNARYMISMLDQAESFNQNLNNWNVSKVINFRSMFSGAHSFNQPIGGGLTTGISNDNIKNVFIEIKTGWDISYAKHMSNMFDNAKSFKQYLGDWEFSPNSERSERPDINKLSFDKHNIKYRYSEETLLNIFNNYKNLSDEDKYKSSIYIKNFKEWNSGKFNKICENLKIDQNIDHNI
jgi:surface protein